MISVVYDGSGWVFDFVVGVVGDWGLDGCRVGVGGVVRGLNCLVLFCIMLIGEVL